MRTAKLFLLIPALAALPAIAEQQQAGWITAPELYEAYKGNQLATIKAMDDYPALYVIGKVHKVFVQPYTEAIFVQLYGGDAFSFVDLEMRPGEDDQVAKIKSGEKVQIKCFGRMTPSFLWPKLSDCKVDADGRPA